MSALSIHGDKWHGVLNDEWHVDRPSWDDVDKAIRRLDAKTYTIVTVQGPGEQHLAIGGGSGRYIVYATFDNCEFWNLLSTDSTNGMVLLNAGGQEGDYPAAQIVDQEQARTAARTFLLDLRLEPSLRWERQ
ncbi:Imm1 family immunity protein [Polyangium jinanense]|uniref:Immunity protein Imm1 n=1 Tax=Polyangium jinanense TaxID=2829994 RepID=A0A9X3X6A7_9BACT|nr:Imm1 family immunity protein [Polyangium jinanense]MDC3982186.1 hypothetical protein [Polyangium jinanense]